MVKTAKRPTTTCLAAHARSNYELFKVFSRLIAERKQDYGFKMTDLVYVFSTDRIEDIPPSELRSLWLHSSACRNSGPERPPTALFISLPFCIGRCRYCQYFKQTPPDFKTLEAYKERLCANAEYFSKVFKKTIFSSVYLGGGTPTIFSEKQLSEICSRVLKHVRTAANAQLTLETNPATVTPGKLRVFIEHGFNRLSLGVQSLNEKVLRDVAREYQNYETVKTAILSARRAGFQEINLDLMFGLKNDSRSGFLRSFAETISLSPDTITLYPLEPTPSYLQSHWAGNRKKFEADLRSKRAWINDAASIAKQNGYDPGQTQRLTDGIGFRRRSKGQMRPAIYQSEISSKGQSLFGLGDKSSSYIFGALRYYTASLAASPDASAYRGWRAQAFDEMRRYALGYFARGEQVPIMEFKKIFGQDFGTAFKSGLRQLTTLGLLERKKRTAMLTRDIDRADRFAAGMFLFEYKDLVTALNHLLGDIRLALRAHGKTHILKLSYSMDKARSAGYPIEMHIESAPSLTRTDTHLHKLLKKIFLDTCKSTGQLDVFKLHRSFKEALRAVFGRHGYIEII